MPLVDRFWFNALWFQINWFVCVLGRENWLPFTLLLLALHFLLVDDPKTELKRLLPLALLGLMVDTALTLLGVFEFDSVITVPLWLIALWIVFATTLYRSLSKFGQNLWLAATAGSLLVPLNYLLGSRLGAVSLPLPELLTFLILMCTWGILLPTLYKISHILKPNL